MLRVLTRSPRRHAVLLDAYFNLRIGFMAQV